MKVWINTTQILLCFKNYYFSRCVMIGTGEKYIYLGFVLILSESEWDNMSFSPTTLNFLSRKKLHHVRIHGVLLIHVLICFTHSVWSKNKLHYSFILILPLYVSFLWFLSGTDSWHTVRYWNLRMYLWIGMFSELTYPLRAITLYWFCALD